MHSLLKRQLSRTYPELERHSDRFLAFIAIIDRTYEEFDIDRKMLDRVLEINSQELLDANAELRLLQEQLRLRNIELEKTLHEIEHMQDTLVQSEKMASIGQLAAGIAHEINNPLSFVSSNLNRFSEYFNEVLSLLDEWRMIGAECPDSEDAAHSIAAVRAREKETDLDFLRSDFSLLMGHTIRGAERMRIIIDRMRVFSHVAGETLSDVDLTEAIDETLILVWNEIKYKARVVKEYDPVPVHAFCNPGELKQVLINLLMNASQAIEDKGTIILRTRVDASNALIEISDTGSGIAPEHQKRIFDPFFTTKPVGTGTGLGLWICATIIARHGGTISVQSVPGTGTTFTISLPKNQMKTA